jgi:hypothetical protein
MNFNPRLFYALAKVVNIANAINKTFESQSIAIISKIYNRHNKKH